MATFYLVGGHGQGDSGAVGNGYQEQALARQFNDKLAAYLKKCGANVEIYDKSKDLYQQTAKGGGLYKMNLNNKIIIETHLNAFNKSAYGSEVLIKGGLKADSYDNAIIKSLSKYFTNRGIKARNDLLNMSVCASKGWNYRLIELCFIDNKDDVTKFVKNMDAIAKDMAQALTGKAATVTTAPKPTPAPKPVAPKPTPAKKSNQVIADEVIAGKWGNGSDREKKLKANGYDFNTIQKLVNDKLLGKKPTPAKKSNDTIANEVINGKWGNGASRESALKKAGYNFNEIQKLVNKKLGY